MIERRYTQLVTLIDPYAAVGIVFGLGISTEVSELGGAVVCYPHCTFICEVGTLHKPDHYSVLTVVLSFSLGVLSALNSVAETFLPLFSAVSIITSMSLTVWYYRAKINELKKTTKHKGPPDG